MKDYPELEKEEIIIQSTKFEQSRLKEIIEGKYYRDNYLKVFGNVNKYIILGKYYKYLYN